MKSEKEIEEIKEKKNKKRNTLDFELIYNDFSEKENKYILILIYTFYF